MPVEVFLVRRPSRRKGKNGRPKTLYSVRWRDQATGALRSETCATTDGVQAETMRKKKWEEVNGIAPLTSHETAPSKSERPSWKKCREAVEKAMRADNLRPGSIADSLLLFDGLQKMFPEIDSPSNLTEQNANDYKRRRSEQVGSPWTVKGDLSALRSLFGKWLGRECGLLTVNPFAGVTPPKCDEPEIRIVSAEESSQLCEWLDAQWANWRLPIVYLQVASLVGWRATEIASMRSEDLLSDGYVRVASASSKTRKHKYGWLPESVYRELVECGADGWAFGRFADDLRRLLRIVKKRPNHAARVKDFTPKRLVGWLQDELQRFNALQAAQVLVERANGNRVPEWQPFTLHDFRRTAITGLQMSGASEKEASLMVGATPEVIRRHYERMDRRAIAKRIVERRVATGGIQLHRPSVECCATEKPEDKSKRKSRRKSG